METHDSRGTSLSLPVQLCYLVLYGLGAVAALVQHGHPALVLGVVVALLPLGLLARLPRRWFPGWLRQVLQVAIAGGGLAWWRLRMQGHAVDVVVVESAAILGAALAVGGVAREYGMLGFISLVLVGYGGVMPGRPPYLPVLCVYLFFGVLLMYETRTLNLAAIGGRAEGRVTQPRYVANWGYRLAHLAMACAFMVILVSTFPLPQGRSVGLIPVSFKTTQEMAFPVLWRRWVQPATELLSRGDPMTQQTTDTSKSQDPNPVPAADAQASIAVRNAPPQMDAREGMGGAGVGTDLVMRVQSPAKLYWLAQLYDTYDGKTWRVSAMLRSAQSGLDRYRGIGQREVDQHVSIEKGVTARLPGAFRVVRCAWDRADAAFSASAETEALPLIRIDAAGASLRSPPTDLPWQYRCTSHVPTLDTESPHAAWESSVNQGWNYRRLPERLISERTRRLATALTQDCETPLKKALALQEHLRRHYTYTLTPAPVPDQAEPVDHFLFESREGYCQHFAQAFTVLARLAGLPARLASGYSPGNHNLLANCFDVYEYHAHAWTQIFIEPYGWLTFDGVAPGNLRLESGPSFLRRLMDPFGEDWNARPPELSLRAPAPPPLHEDPRPGGARSLTRVAEGIYARAMLESRSLEPGASAVTRAAGETLKEWLRQQLERAQGALTAWADHAWARTVDAARRFLAYLRSLSAAAYVAVTAAAIAAGLLWQRRRLLAAVVATAWARWHCRRHWRRLQGLRDREPSVVLSACAEVLHEVMGLGSFLRPANLDALEYAEWLRQSEPRIAVDYGVFAHAQCRMLYRDVTPTRADADSAVGAVGRIHAEILRRLTLSGVRRRLPPVERPTSVTPG